MLHMLPLSFDICHFSDFYNSEQFFLDFECEQTSFISNGISTEK